MDVEVSLRTRLVELEAPRAASLEFIQLLIQVCMFQELLHLDNQIFAQSLGKTLACFFRIQALWLANQPLEDANYETKFDADAVLSPLKQKLERFNKDDLLQKLQEIRKVIELVEPIVQIHSTDGVLATLRPFHALAVDLVPHLEAAVAIEV